MIFLANFTHIAIPYKSNDECLNLAIDLFKNGIADNEVSSVVRKHIRKRRVEANITLKRMSHAENAIFGSFLEGLDLLDYLSVRHNQVGFNRSLQEHIPRSVFAQYQYALNLLVFDYIEFWTHGGSDACTLLVGICGEPDDINGLWRIRNCYILASWPYSPTKLLSLAKKAVRSMLRKRIRIHSYYYSDEIRAALSEL